MNENFTFDGQRSDEEVIFVLKRHPWVLSRAGFLFVGIVVFLLIFILIFGLSKITSILIVVFVIFALLHGGYIFFLYNNFLYILTNERIITIEQAGFFSRRVTEAELDKIQNISVEIKGITKTLFGFGHVQIRTAGVDPTIVLKDVENPYEVQQKIIKFTKKESLKTLDQPIIR